MVALSIDVVSAAVNLLTNGVRAVNARWGTEWVTLDGNDQSGIARVRVTATAPVEAQPDWVMITLLHDDGRKMAANIKYGHKALLRIPDGHYSVLALFLSEKSSSSHRPDLIAVAAEYVGVFVGKQQSLLLNGRYPGTDDLSLLQSVSGPGPLPFVLDAAPRPAITSGPAVAGGPGRMTVLGALVVEAGAESLARLNERRRARQSRKQSEESLRLLVREALRERGEANIVRGVFSPAEIVDAEIVDAEIVNAEIVLPGRVIDPRNRAALKEMLRGRDPDAYLRCGRCRADVKTSNLIRHFDLQHGFAPGR